MQDCWTDSLAKTSLSERLKTRLLASRQVFLDEVKPGRKQVEHGLGLHYDSAVADAQGSIASWFVAGIRGDRLASECDAQRARLTAQERPQREIDLGVEKYARERKTLESAFDAQWQQWRRELYVLTGVNVAAEDVSGPDHNDFETALWRLARARLAYDRARDVALIGHADDLEHAVDEELPGVVLHMAGVGAFAEAEDPIRNIDLFYALGIRMMQLTYIQQNKLCASWLQGDEDKGLTDLGRVAVARMNELGIMVDIAHCGVRSAMDIVEASSEPVLLSHTACQGVYDDRENGKYVDLVLKQPYAAGVTRPAGPVSARNASDELLRALAQRGGVAGLYNISYMLAPGDDWSFGAFARHVEHAVAVAGVEHVAFGTDRTVFPTWPPHACEWSNWPYYTVGLVCLGFSDDEVRRLIGGNYLHYARRVLSKTPWGLFPATAASVPSSARPDR